MMLNLVGYLFFFPTPKFSENNGRRVKLHMYFAEVNNHEYPHR